MDTLRERLRRLALAARRSEETATVDRENRDAAIEDASIEGLSVRVIAEATGLSPARVQQIVLVRTAARQDRLAKAAQLDGPPLPI